MVRLEVIGIWIAWKGADIDRTQRCRENSYRRRLLRDTTPPNGVEIRCL